MSPIFKRKIKGVTGDGSSTLKVFPSVGVRVHKLALNILISAGGVTTLGADTLVAFCAATKFRLFSGSVELWKGVITGTHLRDFMLLHGTTYDFNGIPSTGMKIRIPLCPEWFVDSIRDGLALNPKNLGGAIRVEIDSTVAMTVTSCIEHVSFDLDAPTAGIMSLQVVSPVAGGTSFYTEKPVIEPRGRLISAHIYPDSTNSRAITPAELLLGSNNAFAHEGLSDVENDDELESHGLTPTASGRTANVYDMAFVKDSGLAQAPNLEDAKEAKIRVQAASAMAGTCDILLVRNEFWK